MRLLAASFVDLPGAAVAFRELDRQFDLGDRVRTKGLGQASDPDGPGGVLAGLVEDDVVHAVKAAIERLGGTVVVDREED